MNTSKTLLIVIAVLVLGAGAVILMRNSKPDQTASQTAAPQGCVAQTLQVGSSGSCVADAKTLVNMMETNNLIECTFEGAARLDATASFDEATATQVKAAQGWVNCYNKEEGVDSMLNVDGVIDAKTWSSLCTYGYRLPKQANQSSSPYFQAALKAGADAGC